MNPDRRRLIATAAALGATAAWGGARARPSGTGWTERRDRFPEGRLLTRTRTEGELPIGDRL